MKKLWFLLVIPLVLLIWWVADMAQSAPSVHYATVKRETIESVVSTNGKLEPEDFAEARAEIAGVVTQVSVKRGQQVKQGDPLVMLDSASEQAAVDTARAQLAEARAEENAVRNGGKLSARTDYEERLKSAQLALADAQRRKESFDRLYAKQAATKEEKLAADAALANAQQQVNAIKANQNALVSPPIGIRQKPN